MNIGGIRPWIDKMSPKKINNMLDTRYRMQDTCVIKNYHGSCIMNHASLMCELVFISGQIVTTENVDIDKCHEGRTEFIGTPRSFGSLYEMALENAWSRVVLGTHWEMDCREGVRFGTFIGRQVNNLPWKKK